MGSIGFSRIGSAGLRRIQMHSARLRPVVTASGSISGFLCIKMDPDEFRLVQMCSGRLRSGSAEFQIDSAQLRWIQMGSVVKPATSPPCIIVLKSALFETAQNRDTKSYTIRILVTPIPTEQRD